MKKQTAHGRGFCPKALCALKKLHLLVKYGICICIIVCSQNSPKELPQRNYFLMRKKRGGGGSNQKSQGQEKLVHLVELV